MRGRTGDVALLNSETMEIKVTAEWSHRIPNAAIESATSINSACNGAAGGPPAGADYWFNRGSSASRNPLPTRLIDRTVM
jgi:hypothetical protein